MSGSKTRREFFGGAAASAASLALGGAKFSEAIAEDRLPLRGRFVTHVSVVRVNQIEVTPNRSIGADESIDNRPERIRSRREAFSKCCLSRWEDDLGNQLAGSQRSAWRL